MYADVPVGSRVTFEFRLFSVLELHMYLQVPNVGVQDTEDFFLAKAVDEIVHLRNLIQLLH